MKKVTWPILISLGLMACDKPVEPRSVAGSFEAAAVSTAQCMKDVDCKGDRICDEGLCTAPAASGANVTGTVPAMKRAELEAPLDVESLDVSGANEPIINYKASQGDCVYPTSTVASFHSEPNGAAQGVLEQQGYTVAAVQGTWAQLVTVPDYDLEDPDAAAGKESGWVMSSDLQPQAFRNCN